MTTGSMFRLLEKEKKNPNYRQDFEKIRDFINENTGFKFDKGFSSEDELNIKALPK